MKILVISHKNPSNYVLKKTFVNSLGNKFKVNFVTFESSISRLYSENEIIDRKKTSNVKFYRVDKINKLNLIINKIKPDLILNYYIESISKKYLELYYYIKKLNIPTIKIMEQPFIWKEKKFLKRIYNIFTKKIFVYDYGLICSETAEYSFYNHHFKNHIYFYNMNYENFINVKKNYKTKKHYLFLDENFVHHPDIKIGKVKNIPKPDIYYNQLIFWFNILNKTSDKKVLIAAHPTTKKNYFKGHPIVFNKTVDFIKKSNLIILHHSSAIDFAILFKKNLLFITSDEINRISDGKYIFELAKYFKTKPINISNNFDNKLLNKYIVKYANNKNLYIKFVREFIKHPMCQRNTKISSIFESIKNEKKI